MQMGTQTSQTEILKTKGDNKTTQAKPGHDHLKGSGWPCPCCRNTKIRHYEQELKNIKLDFVGQSSKDREQIVIFRLKTLPPIAGNNATFLTESKKMDKLNRLSSGRGGYVRLVCVDKISKSPYVCSLVFIPADGTEIMRRKAAQYSIKAQKLNEKRIPAIATLSVRGLNYQEGPCRIRVTHSRSISFSSKQ